MFQKRNKIIIFAPVQGKVISLDQVDDPVFSNRMMGDGLAIQAVSNEVCAPCDATVALISKAQHAIVLKVANDIELLIHIGIQTTNFTGGEFHPRVKVGDYVKQGDRLIYFDLQRVQGKHDTLEVPMIILNHSSYTLSKIRIGTMGIARKTKLFEILY